MGYNQANYTRIRKDYETKYLRAREDADRRRAEALRAIPELADIDRALGQKLHQYGYRAERARGV